MRQILRRTCLVALLTALALSGQRVVLVSFDGLGYQAYSKDPVAEELTVLRATARRGVTAQGIQPAFPSTTANSHAALWTGCYGDCNHISANTPPLLPRSEHTFLERGNGFFSHQLAAEPIWVAAARQGRPSVAHQPPQGYPFKPLNSTPGAVILNGYQARQFAPHGLYTRSDAKLQPDGSLNIQHGPLSLHIRRQGAALRISVAGAAGSVVVRPQPAESEPPRKRALARRFGHGLFVEQPAPAVVYFRLFSLEGEQFRLYVSPLSELGASEPMAELFRQAGGFIGNGPSGLLAQRRLSEAEYLEVVELVIRQMVRHAAWLDRRYHPRLLQSYLPFPDEFEHAWLDGSAEHERWRRWGYVAVNRGAEAFARLAGRPDYLLWVSDHGMAPVTRNVNIIKALHDAGLDSRVSYLYNSVLLNTTDWKGGTVTDGDAVLQQTRRVLGAIEDNGRPVVTAFYTPALDGARFGIGGPAGGDLYFDLAPGYAVSATLPTLTGPAAHPGGVHGFMPLRDEMLAVLVGRGPRLQKGAVWPRLRSIDVAPLVADLLGIDAPRQARGRSPLTGSAARN